MIIHGQFTEREKEIANIYGKDSRPHLGKEMTIKATVRFPARLVKTKNVANM